MLVVIIITHFLFEVDALLSAYPELVKNLLEELDKPLYEFFEVSECSDFLFCHR